MPSPSTQPHLFAPLTIREISLRNRIMVSPMCQYSVERRDGRATDWHLVHLGARAVGGAGLVCAEATAVTPEGRISPEDLGIWSDEHVEPLARITRFLAEHGAAPGIQLAHAGRKASTRRPWDGGGPLPMEQGGWQVVGPSPVPFDEGYQVPHVLEHDEIRAIVDAFRQGARRSLDAGFQVIELHAAHGYLLHQFLSPVSNLRGDEYGGSFENRIRLTVEVVRAIREVWPARLPLFVRVSATDWLEKVPGTHGWDLEQTVALASVLRDDGVDAFDCSSGGNVARVRVPVGSGYQVPFAAAVRRQSGMPSIAVGMINAPEQADQIIRTGEADLVALARAELRNPNWPLAAARTLHAEAPWPEQYVRARD